MALHFDDNAATIKIDDTPRAAAALQSGHGRQGPWLDQRADNATGNRAAGETLVEVRGHADFASTPPQTRRR